MIAVPSGSPTSGSLNFMTPCSTFKVSNGKIWIKIDLGDQYQFGSNSIGIPFNINVNLDLVLQTSAATNPTINFDLTLNNSKPEAMVYLDLAQYLDETNLATGLSYLAETIVGVEAVVNAVSDSSGTIDLSTNLGIALNYELNYGIDVSNNMVLLISNTADINSKVVVFEWTDTCDAPNYEFQLLRLYNKDLNFLTDEKNISTNLDWTKALSFQTQNSKKQLALTIGEGQGFYVWRVRPLGTFYSNGIGNAQNWGIWNASSFDSGNHEFSAPAASNEYFFFTDPDDNTNYQYSRVFTEGNKISEQATYATTLNQVKQTQRYFPSKDYKIISQTVLDKSGRPTLTTLPVPVEGESISKYKNNFVTTNAELYRAKHFDLASNYTQPAIIDASGAFAYYSSLNIDKRIPNAEGYPFTRVIFSNDGTDRVVEQSGVGKTHMIGDQNSGQGRTVRTLYGTPTEEELVALFGDEAPDAENTAKVITIDPNNTKSVAYITKEGNTIATGLTFSEDEAVLDKIESGPVVSGKIDKITNNIRTNKGFNASKRITILEDATEINVGYTIAKPILEGLCNSLEIQMDYSLLIQVFDINTNEVVQEFKENSIAEFLSTDNSDLITIDFGSMNLNTGSYYIQKTLVPADDVTTKLVASKDNLKKLIEPYFNWLVNALDEIDCEEEMQYLYNDIFFYGQKINQQALAENNGLLEFNCVDCSGITTQFLSKDLNDPEASDEFLDFYAGNEDQYAIQIIYQDENGQFLPINYATTTSLGNIKPVEVRFSTPCCDFDIPIVFTPPFKKPSPEALLAYIGDATATTQLNNSTSYYDSSMNSINPNNYFLTQNEENFVYEKNLDGSVTIINKDAYPLDFEGYAISMLYECKSSVDSDYTMIQAREAIYNAMRGWHKPGLLNQMVYHMATDNYGEFGCNNRDESLIGTGGSTGSGSNSTNTGVGYHSCDVEENPVKINNAQYSVKELAECWEPIVIQLVNEICTDQFQADIDQSSNVAQNVDVQDSEAVNNSVKEIKSWIIRWISRGKIKRKLRKKNAGTTENIADEVEKRSGNMVKTFLDCTGYAFADIVDPVTATSDFPEFAAEFDDDASNGEYNPERLINGSSGLNWLYFTIDPELSGTDYVPPVTNPTEEITGILNDIFPNLQDPVYAFKYYAYKSGTFPQLEAETCYRDPNLCYDTNNNVVPCCGTGSDGKPIPCNFCGIGYITCPYDRDTWSCGQRFTFYEMIKTYEETAQESSNVVISCENYYEDVEYIHNPDFGKLLSEENEPDNSGIFELEYINADIPLDVFTDLPYLSKKLVDAYVLNKTFEDLKSEGVVELKDINGTVQTSGVSIIENDAYAMQSECAGNCDDRRDEFREKLIKAFSDRCYEIGECKITPNDNIIPYADIEIMLDNIIEQCKLQCVISTYACSDEPCRLPSKSPFEFGGSPEASSDFNTSYIDYGVSGPVITSNRDQSLIIIDPVSGVITDTGDSVTTQNISLTGTLEKYSYVANPSIWDVRRSLTYAEYSRWIQAMEWDIVLDVPSKCDEFGFYNDQLTYDSNGIPQQTVFIEETVGVWVAQDLSNFPYSSPYISRDNPTGPGDTFKERDEYIKTSSTPVSADDPAFKEPIISPKIGIKVEIDNN